MKMKAMAFTGLTFAVAIMLSVAAFARPILSWPMLVSVHPLFADDKDTVFQPELLGGWRGGGDTIITFERAEGNTYVLTITPIQVKPEWPPVKEVYRAHLIPLGKCLFLDLFPADELVLPHDGLDVGSRERHFWRVHSFMLVRRTPKLLQLSPVDYRAFSTTSGVESMERDGRLLLLCPTTKLRILFEKHSEDKALTGGTFDYTREKAQETREGTPRR